MRVPPVIVSSGKNLTRQTAKLINEGHVKKKAPVNLKHRLAKKASTTWVAGKMLKNMPEKRSTESVEKLRTVENLHPSDNYATALLHDKGDVERKNLDGKDSVRGKFNE